ncbi:MAG: DDE-type integrase/transposase/recombinase [Bdellovibrionota bacterium]
MSEKMPECVSKQALARYQAISEVTKLCLAGKPKTVAVAEAAMCVFYDPKTGNPITFSERSIYRFLRAYQSKSLPGLESAKRKFRSKGSRVLSNVFVDFIVEEKKIDPLASTVEIIQRARAKGVLEAHEKVCRTTVYRLCLKLNLPITKQLTLRSNDMRRFAYPHRMMMILSDGKHFKAGIYSTPRVLFSFLDDATRMILACSVSSSENTRAYLRGLDRMFRKFGIPQMIYLDRGPAFISSETAQVLSKLGIALIFGKKRYPEGHGKIERYHRSLINDLLRSFDKNPAIDPSFEALEHRINHYLFEIYNRKTHSGEGMEEQSPYDKFFSDDRTLTPIRDLSIYEGAFILRYARRVSKDNIISFKDTSFEVPTGHALCMATIFHHLLTDQVSLLHDGRLVRLSPVDLSANAFARRAMPKPCNQQESQVMPNLAASILYEKAHSGLVDNDGNALLPKNERIHDEVK